MMNRKSVLTVVAGSILLTGCGAAQQGASALPPEAVSVAKVQTSPLTIGDTFLGTVTPYIQTQLYRLGQVERLRLLMCMREMWFTKVGCLLRWMGLT